MAESKAKKPRKKSRGNGYYLTPKGCLYYAVDKVCPGLTTDDQKDLIWMVFEDIMKHQGYITKEIT